MLLFWDRVAELPSLVTLDFSPSGYKIPYHIVIENLDNAGMFIL